jgi:di/tricarboxylate transporter
MILTQSLSAIIILVTYAAIAVGRVPGLRMNRATIALVGAALLLGIGALTEEQAFAAIDLGTIILLDDRQCQFAFGGLF